MLQRGVDQAGLALIPAATSTLLLLLPLAVNTQIAVVSCKLPARLLPR